MKIWRLAVPSLICDMLTTHQMIDNTIVLELITSNSAFEVGKSI